MQPDEYTNFLILTLSYHNFNLIRDLNNVITSEKDNKIKDLYYAWCEYVGSPRISPMHAGSVWMITAAVLLTAKTWLNIFPNEKRYDLSEDWGLLHADIKCSKHGDNPPLHTIVRRSRNAIAHGRIEYQGSNIGSGTLKQGYMIFRDIDKKTNSTFYMKITLFDLSRFQSKIYEQLREDSRFSRFYK